MYSKASHFLLFSILLLFCRCPTLSTRLKQRMYHDFPLDQFSFCTRYLTASGMVGCSSPFNGAVGDVFIVSDTETLHAISTNSYNLPSGEKSLIFVMNLTVFTNANSSSVDGLRSVPQVGGLLLLLSNNSTDLPESFSEDSPCPGASYSYYNTTGQCQQGAWNPPGKNYFNMDWPFPIIILNNFDGAASRSIEACYVEHNIRSADHRRCALELRTFMDAVTSAAVCLRRSQYVQRNFMLTESSLFCDAFKESPNIYVHSGARVVDPTSQEKAILVMTRMDTRSLFFHRSFGVRSVLPNLSILLSVVKHLNNLPEFKNHSTTNPQVIFAFLSYEAFDYMGSEKLAYSLERGLFFPRKSNSDGLAMQNIQSVLELGPVGSKDYSQIKQIFAHTTADSSLLAELSSTFQNLTGDKVKLDVTTHHKTKVLPPASSQSILKRNSTLPVIFLTDSDKSFTDSLFHSIFDQQLPLSVNETKLLSAIANTLAAVLYKQATGKELLQLIPVESGPEEFLHCFVFNNTCLLFQRILGGEVKSDSLPIPPTATFWTDERAIGSFLWKIIFSMLMEGVDTVKKKEECTNEMADFSYYYNSDANVSTPNCFRAPIIYDLDLNPVMYRLKREEGKDGSFEWPSEHPSAAVWVASSMTTMPRVRLFVRPSKTYEVLLVLGGIFVTLVATLLSLFLSKKRNVLFPPEELGEVSLLAAE